MFRILCHEPRWYSSCQLHVCIQRTRNVSTQRVHADQNEDLWFHMQSNEYWVMCAPSKYSGLSDGMFHSNIWTHWMKLLNANNYVLLCQKRPLMMYTGVEPLVLNHSSKVGKFYNIIYYKYLLLLSEINFIVIQNILLNWILDNLF